MLMNHGQKHMPAFSPGAGYDFKVGCTLNAELGHSLHVKCMCASLFATLLCCPARELLL